MPHARKDPLGRFSAIRTSDVGELRQRLSGLFSVRSFDVNREVQQDFDAHLNHYQLNDVGLSFARYGSSIEASLSHTDFYLQGFPLRGNGSFAVDGSETIVSRRRGLVTGMGAEVRLRYSPEFEHLIVRIKPQALIKKLSALIGRPVDPPLTMVTDIAPDSQTAAAQFRLLEFVIGELDREDASLPPLVLAELEQALLVAFLCSNRHNYSHLFNEQPLAPAPWQVRRVEEYIEQNWDQPLTISFILSKKAAVSLR
jgi:hypothetical protein